MISRALVCGALTLGACKHAEEAPEAAPPGPPAATDGPTSEVERPVETFVWAVAMRPSATVDALQTQAGTTHDWRKAWASLSSPLVELIDLEAPLTAAVAITTREGTSDKQFPFAWSAGVGPAEVAVAALQSAGVVGTDDGGKFRFKVEQGTCVLGRSRDPVRGRVVCSAGARADAALALFGAHMLQGPRPEPGALSLRASVSVPVLRDAFAAELGSLPEVARSATALLAVGLRDAELQRTVVEVATELATGVRGFVEDIDALETELGLEPGRGGFAAVQLRMATARSGVAKFLHALESTAIAAPERLWSLPAEVSSAGFVAPSPAADPATTARVRRLFEGGGRELGLDAARVAAVLDTLFSGSRHASVSATLPIGDRHRGSAPKWLGLSWDQDLIWAIEGGDAVRDLSTFEALYVDPRTRKGLTELLKRFAVEADLPRLRRTPIPAGKGLPPGSRAWELAVSIPADTGKRPTKLRVMVIATTEPGSTHVAVGHGDLSRLAASLGAMRAPTAAAGLGRRPDLADVKGVRSWSLELDRVDVPAFVERLGDLVGDTHPAIASKYRAMMAGLSGSAPTSFVRSTTRVVDGDLRIEMRIPTEAVAAFGELGRVVFSP